jgi:hypothetical protein
VGTIFEESRIGLDRWFATIWLSANAENEVSSVALAKAIGVTQKTAWLMLDRLRLASQTGSFKAREAEVGLGTFQRLAVRLAAVSKRDLDQERAERQTHKTSR